MSESKFEATYPAIALVLLRPEELQKTTTSKILELLPLHIFPQHSALIATLAPLRYHVPPFFETASSVPAAYPSAELHLPSKPSGRLASSPIPLLSFLVILVVFAVQIFKDPINLGLSVSETSHCEEGPLLGPLPVCRARNPLLEPQLVSRPHKMSLLEEAKRVAAEFEYSPEDLNKGVKAFISQMRRWDRFGEQEKC